MGLLLSVLITCVGVLEVIACYTHFRLGVAYNECKTNVRQAARYYALELRKHELHFESNPNDPGPSTSSDTLSELIKNKRQSSPLTVNSLAVNGTNTHEGSPNPAANLKVPRNSISELSPTEQLSPEIDLTQAVEKIQHEFDWKSRSPSPFPESDSGVETKSPDIPELSDIPESLPCSPENRDLWNKSPIVDEGYTKTDLEVQNITEKITRQPSPYPDVLFGITENIDEETKFDEEFLRSLDGVKSSRCDDKRRSFRKKRNSSSTSSRASEISRSLTSLDEIDNIERLELKKIEPLAEEEELKPEKCESIASPILEEQAKYTNQEQTKFEAKVNQNSSQEVPGKNISFTEKVKDLEISVQLLVTVKGTSQGDKMEYTTTVNQEPSKNEQPNIVKEEITKSSEENSEFGKVKTSVTYGTSSQEDQQNLKDLQISSQSLIHAERTLQDDVNSSEAEFLKLYESFTELPDNQKDEFLKIIGQPKPEVENEENIEDLDEEVANITKNIPKSILKKIPEHENREIPEIKEEIIEDLNLPDDLSKETSEIIRSMSPFRPDEKVHITEITEITESTESVITIPPETKNQASDAKTFELSDKTDNSQVLSTKECDQDSIENKQANEQMKAENKNTQTIGSQEKIEHVISKENINEKCISTVTTKEPQVVRQLTTRKNDIAPTINGQQIDEPVAKITSISAEEIKDTTIIEQSPIIVDQTAAINNTSTQELTQNDPICKVTSFVVEQPISSVTTETIATVTTLQQEQIPDTSDVQNVVEQQVLKVENVPNQIQVTKIEQQSTPEAVVQETVQQQTITTIKDIPVQTGNVITTTLQQEPTSKTDVEQNLNSEIVIQQQTTTEQIPVQNQNIVQEITTITTTKQQESIPETHVEQIGDQQTILTTQEIPLKTENVSEEITTITTNVQQETTPETFTKQQIVQQVTTSQKEIPEQNKNVSEEITTTTVQQETTPETVTKQQIVQQVTTSQKEIPLQNKNISGEITTTVQQEITPKSVVEQKTVQQVTTSQQEIPLQNQNISEEITTVTTTVQQEITPKTVTEPPSVQKVTTSQQEIPLQNQNISEEITTVTTTVQQETTPKTVTEEKKVTTLTETSTIPHQLKETVNKETVTLSETKSDQSQIQPPTETKLETTSKNESSSESSSTPSTVVESRLRKAAKTSFEDATPVQNQEMMRRKLSSSEVSPKQASQAFWLIFSAEYTNAMEKDWHGQHFSCWQCDESLTGQRYVLRDDHPYCVKCYEQVFANPCEKCNRIIGIDSKDLSYKDKHWHEACFQCTTCSESLVDKQFGAKGEKIYCGNCYDKQFASRCDGCGKIFHAGTKKMEYKNRQWHEQCFKCCKCETPIGTKSFIPREKDIYCAGCYEEKFATRCVKCDKAIQSGGVTYKNEPWHRECFTCTHCNKNLAGQRFTSRDDKPCCADCFGKLFAKRCTSCSEPITGIGGTRFISFEDRHWHNDCFICASCSTSLVGRGFITDEDKIICPECAKERFM